MKMSEEKNEMLSVMVNICTRVVTLIFIVTSIAMAITGQLEEIRWSVRDIWGVLLIGIVSGLCIGIFYIKKNMSAKIIGGLQILYFFILNAVLFFIGLKLGWFAKEVSSVISMEIMFVVIYFAVSFLVYLFDFNEAKKINKIIQDRKKSKPTIKDD